MQPRPVGLLDTSDKELLAIFDALSSTPRVLDPAALALALTCSRLHELYRFDYVTGFDCHAVHAFSQQKPLLSLESGGVARIFSRLPRVVSVTVFLKNWKAICHLNLPIPPTITYLALCDHIDHIVPRPALCGDEDHTPREPTLALSTALAGALPAAPPHLAPDQFTYSERILPAFAAALPRLRHLSIHNCDVEFGAAALEDFASLSSLTTLSLHTCDASAKRLGHMLAKMPSLVDLDLENFNFDAALVDFLPPRLERLRLHDNATGFYGNLHNDKVGAICALPHLRHLDISGCLYLTEWSVLLPAAARLESLTLAHCPLFVSYHASCKAILSSMSNLRRLTLRDTCEEYDEVLYAAATLPKLEELTLASDEVEYEDDLECPVTMCGISALANGVSRLSLTLLTLDLAAVGGLGCALREHCHSLFAPRPGLPVVRLTCEF